MSFLDVSYILLIEPIAELKLDNRLPVPTKNFAFNRTNCGMNRVEKQGIWVEILLKEPNSLLFKRQQPYF